MSEDALKPRVDFLQTLFIWIAGALVTVVLAFIVLVWNVTSSINGRIDRSTETTSAVSREVAQVAVKVDDGSRRLDRIEQKLDILISRNDPKK